MNKRAEIERKREEQFANRELNRETVQDLTEREADEAKGGNYGTSVTCNCPGTSRC